MKTRLLRQLAFCAALLQASAVSAQNGDFSFTVISHMATAAGESALREAVEASDADNLAFVVVNGIKATTEPCSDKLYKHRKALLHEAKNGVIVSLAASDWVECRGENGRSAAMGKLNLLRDLLFGDEFSVGASRIPVVRQSTIARFRGFPENARWEIGDVMFATINVPANNNHYVSDAGRNSEFEDRLVANRDWLHRIFLYAKQRKHAAVVLFCDGNPLIESKARTVKRDGYMEIRRALATLAASYPGKVLVVHGQGKTPSGAIRWQGNLGEFDAGVGVSKIAVSRSASEMIIVQPLSSSPPEERQ
jgi:hypothetical protein